VGRVPERARSWKSVKFWEPVITCEYPFICEITAAVGTLGIFGTGKLVSSSIVVYRAAAGTRVINYPGNFLLPAATRVPEQKQITANVLNIRVIFNRIYGIRILIYRILTQNQ